MTLHPLECDMLVSLFGGWALATDPAHLSSSCTYVSFSYRNEWRPPKRFNVTERRMDVSRLMLEVAPPSVSSVGLPAACPSITSDSVVTFTVTDAAGTTTTATRRFAPEAIEFAKASDTWLEGPTIALGDALSEAEIDARNVLHTVVRIETAGVVWQSDPQSIEVVVYDPGLLTECIGNTRWCGHLGFVQPGARTWFDVGRDEADEVDLFTDGQLAALSIEALNFDLFYRGPTDTIRGGLSLGVGLGFATAADDGAGTTTGTTATAAAADTDALPLSGSASAQIATVNASLFVTMLETVRAEVGWMMGLTTEERFGKRADHGLFLGFAMPIDLLDRLANAKAGTDAPESDGGALPAAGVLAEAEPAPEPGPTTEPEPEPEPTPTPTPGPSPEPKPGGE